MSPDPAPLIVSAAFAGEDQAWLDQLRRAHFPPERNHLAAHLTLFHHLPPSLEAELKQRLVLVTRNQVSPPTEAIGVMGLGSGVAIRIASSGLAEIRAGLADSFRGLLTPQDAAGWRPHVTIQNKVTANEARALQQRLEREFRPVEVRLAALCVWRYRGGPWEAVSRHSFSG